MCYLILHLFLNGYWRFVHKDYASWQLFDFISDCVQVLLFSFISVMYYLSYRHLRRLQENVISRDHSLINMHKFVQILFVIYILMALSSAYSTYTQGLFDWQDFLSSIIVYFSFFALKIMLPVILAKLQMDVKLHTQVLHCGQVDILGVDQFEKEVLRMTISVNLESVGNGG